MSPSSTVHGGQHDTRYVAFELLMHAAFVADEICVFMLEPASIQCATYDVQYLMCEERLWFAMCGIIILEMFKVWCLMPEVCCLMIAAYRPKFDVFTVWTWMSESWCSVFDVRRATIVAFLCSLVAGVWCLMIGLSCGLWSDVRCSKCWCSTFDVQ